MESAIVMVKNPGQSNWEGLGTHRFQVLPQIGERIDIDVEGTGYSYEVVAVHHPEEPATNAADVYAVRISTVTEAAMRLFEESPPAT